MSSDVMTPPKLEPLSSRLSRFNLVGMIRQHGRRKMRVVQIALLILNAIVLILAFSAAYAIRFIAPTEALFDPGGQSNLDYYVTYAAIFIPMWLIVLVIFRLYDPAILFGGLREYASAFNACTTAFVFVIFVGYLDPSLVLARGWLLAAWIFSVILIFIERFVFRRLIYALRHRGHFRSTAYIVGANDEGVAIAEQLMASPAAGINILGFLDDSRKPGEEVLPGLVVHGPTTRAQTLTQRFGVDRLIVATSGIHRENMVDLFRGFVNSDQVSMWLSSGLYEILTTGVQIQDVASVPMVSVNRVRLTGINIVAKAVLDYVGAFVGLILLSPLFLGIAITMKLTDPGPIIYRRRVVGVGGKEFDAFKFRTMVVNSKEVLEELLARDPRAREEWIKFFKLKDDPRITRVGAFLRKTSIDEFPQLVNVLRGEMSLVGPRMITMEEVQKYGKWGLNLHTVKPGITGLWQVTGRSELTYEERVRLDMNYIRNYSIWRDIQILIETVPAVLMSRGAY